MRIALPERLQHDLGPASRRNHRRPIENQHRPPSTELRPLECLGQLPMTLAPCQAANRQHYESVICNAMPAPEVGVRRNVEFLLTGTVRYDGIADQAVALGKVDVTVVGAVEKFNQSNRFNTSGIRQNHPNFRSR